MRRITYKPAALKALRRMPANTAKRIIGKVDGQVLDVLGVGPRGGVYG